MQDQMDQIQLDNKAGQDCQQSYFDSKRTDQKFEEGEMVLLQIKPKKSSLSLGNFKKLSACYCGPYVITRKIRNQANELLFFPHIKVHNVFHVNLLKTKFSPYT